MKTEFNIYLWKNGEGWEFFKSFLVEGELYFENVISDTHPEFGVLGVMSIPTELINQKYEKYLKNNQ